SKSASVSDGMVQRDMDQSYNAGPPARTLRMPLAIADGAPTLVMRREAYERSGLSRADLDARLGLTAEEFRVEGSLVAIGPVVGEDSLSELIEELERIGLTYFDDFFELSGNWPNWLRLVVIGAEPHGRVRPRPA